MRQEVVVPYVPRRAFLHFHARTEQEAVMVCHRRAGKTVAICNDGQKRCCLNPRKTPPPRYAWFYPTRVRAKDIAWGYLKHFSSCIPGVRHIESELAVEYPNGGRFTLYGADNARGVGLYLDGVYYDEADEIPKSTIADVAPALADYSGFSVYAGMLKGRYNLWKRYEEARLKPGLFTMMLRASESGILPQKELDRLKDTMGEAAYEMQLECNANASIANAIYGAQMDQVRKDGRICRLSLDPTVPMDFFADIGHSLTGDDWSWWGIQFQGRDILAQRYFANTGEMPSHYAAEIIRLAEACPAGLGTVFLPHDGNRKDRQGRTAKDDLEAAGIKRIKVVSRNPNKWDGINDVRALLPRCYFDQESCSKGWTLGEIDMPSGIDCLDFYTKKIERQTGLITEDTVHNQYSHGADAFRTMADAWRQKLIESAFSVPEQGFNVTRQSGEERPRRFKVNR